MADANLGYCKILSPVDGVVISRAVDVGQTLPSSFSTPTLFQIANGPHENANWTPASPRRTIGGHRGNAGGGFTVDGLIPTAHFHGGVAQVRNSPITVNNVVHLRHSKSADQQGLTN